MDNAIVNIKKYHDTMYKPKEEELYKLMSSMLSGKGGTDGDMFHALDVGKLKALSSELYYTIESEQRIRLLSVYAKHRKP